MVIGPIPFDETVFVNDPAPNARHFFGPDFDLVGQLLLTDEQPLVDSEDSDSDPEPTDQAADPDIVLVQEGVEGQQDRLPTSPRAADPVDFPVADPPLLAPLAGFAEEMARYERPPTFNGDQDPKEWLENYENAAQRVGGKREICEFWVILGRTGQEMV